MRSMNLAIILCLFAGGALAQAAATWEVRKMPSGRCEVVRIDPETWCWHTRCGPLQNETAGRRGAEATQENAEM